MATSARTCTPLVADLFLICYEKYSMLSLSDNNEADIIEWFMSISIYLDGLLNTAYSDIEENDKSCMDPEGGGVWTPPKKSQKV